MFDSSKWVFGITSVLILVTELVLAASTKQDNTTSPLALTALNTSTTQIREQHLLCLNVSHNCTLFTCFDSWPTLSFGHCATYNEDTRVLSRAECPHHQTKGYNLTSSGGRVRLPRSLLQLNHYMCDPLNRKGPVCSECADGFGPSFTSFHYKCVKCQDAWYRMPLFIFFELFPITVFYLIILVFQISVTSAPMPCFIMLAQLFVFAVSSPVSKILLHVGATDDGSLTLEMKVILTFYGLFNLDFFHYDILPPYCLSNKLQPIHIALLRYISVFYPMLLIFLTWVCIELHGRNFSPLVWLWRPFHRCFVRLRRGWDTKSDIIDVFTTFFFLSHNKLTFQALLFLNAQVFINEDESCNRFYSYFNFGDRSYILYTIPIILASLAFIVIPPLLLMLYPFKTFRSFLSKCRLDFTFLNIFIDKVYCCYRNGLDGGRDMRSVSSLHFFLKMMTVLVAVLSHRVANIPHYYFVSTLFFIVTLFMAFAKPYWRPYMNYADTLLLSLMTLLCFTLSTTMFETTGKRILLASPIAVIILIHVRKICVATMKAMKFCTSTLSASFLKKCYYCFRAKRASTTDEPSLGSSFDTSPETQPLIPPTCTIATR